MRCQCLTLAGEQCQRKAKAKGSSKYCFQHQKCKKMMVTAITPSGGESKNRAKEREEVPFPGMLLFGSEPSLEATILALTDLNAIKALCASNKQIKSLCERSGTIHDHIKSLSYRTGSELNGDAEWEYLLSVYPTVDVLIDLDNVNCPTNFGGAMEDLLEIHLPQGNALFSNLGGTAKKYGGYAFMDYRIIIGFANEEDAQAFMDKLNKDPCYKAEFYRNP